MPSIRFVKPYPEISVEDGANLMKSLLKAGLPVASSCNGDGVCGKCRVTIINAEKLSEPTALENELAKKYSLKANQRISCQTQIHGNIEVDTTYW